ncbi:MAG TPA: hypothetical protein VGM43_14635 [Bryobacteraceae bacterium]
MKSVLRPTTPDDLPAVSEFLLRVFGAGPDAPFVQPAVMHWKYWGPRADYSGPRAYVLERDGAITAHVGLWPITLNGIPGVHMIDWASAPEAPGAGLLIVQKLNAMFDFIIAMGGSAMTRTILPAYGFVEHTQQWKGARPIHPLRQILTHQHKNWKLIPRLGRNLMWSRGLSTPAGWTTEQIAPEKVDSSSLVPRSAEFFRYLMACPVAPVHFYQMREGNTPRGHFVLSAIRGQARLAGLWLRETKPEYARAAYALAQVEGGKLAGANEFTAAGSGTVTEQAARESGLRLSDEMTPVFLLNKKKNLTLPPDFQFQPVENDGFFLDGGDYCYLT